MGDSLMKPKHEQFFKEHRPVKEDGTSVIPPDPQKQGIRPPHRLSLNHGDRAMVGTAVLFDGSSTELNHAAREVLLGFVPLVRGKPQKLEIRGHASHREAAGHGTGDAWQLSYQRCLNTLRFLEEQGIAGQQIRLSQAGSTEPYSIGLQMERLAMNSRVEVFLLNEFAEESRGSPEEREQRYQTPIEHGSEKPVSIGAH
jgi:chemotaxis protein MotB